MNEIESPDPTSLLYEAETSLRSEISSYDSLEESTRRSLLAAEFLYDQIAQVGLIADIVRPTGFSYAFAVENEAKARLGARVRRFVEDPGTAKLIQQLLETRGDRLSLFYERYLLRTLREFKVETTPDNFFHTFSRIREHGVRYRPDGLKALGILIVAFGRFYSFEHMGKEIEIFNPLRMSGLTDSDAALKFGVDLMNLQHARNPFIHPELGDPISAGSMRIRTIGLLRTLSEI